MAVDNLQKTKRCTSCGGDYLLEFFRLSGRSDGNFNQNRQPQRHCDRCIGCESLRKREEPIRQRLRKKAAATRRRHGAKLKELGLIKDESDLEKMYGWSLDRMMDDIERVKEKGCPYCLQYIDRAENENLTITLDILNSEQAPHYSTNVIWCCSRCNSEKQRTPPDIWGARQSMWHLWRRNQVRLGANPEEFGFLPYSNDRAKPSTLW
jgi:hypothetical protein